MLLLALPHTIALAIPMAVFVAVSWVFTRLAAEGVLASAQRERHGFRRLVTPVLAAAAIIAALTFVSNTQIVPRTNTRLAALLADAPRGRPTILAALPASREIACPAAGTVDGDPVLSRLTATPARRNALWFSGVGMAQESDAENRHFNPGGAERVG